MERVHRNRLEDLNCAPEEGERENRPAWGEPGGAWQLSPRKSRWGRLNPVRCLERTLRLRSGQDLVIAEIRFRSPASRRRLQPDSDCSRESAPGKIGRAHVCTPV